MTQEHRHHIFLIDGDVWVSDKDLIDLTIEEEQVLMEEIMVGFRLGLFLRNSKTAQYLQLTLNPEQATARKEVNIVCVARIHIWF